MVSKIIAESCGIEIRAEKEWHYSFFSSPYQAHRDFAAVDIDQNKAFGDLAVSPVTGEVAKILRFDSPTPTTKTLPEHLTIIKNREHVSRIMHIEPTAEIGDVIEAGDPLGRFVCNGFFSYWVGPIMHVEIRRPGDFLRARGGCELKPLRKNGVRKRQVEELTGRITGSGKNNISVSLNNPGVGAVAGQPALLDGATCLDYAGVWGSFPVGETVYYNGIPLGRINKTGKYMSTYKTNQLVVCVNGKPFEGISFMSCGHARLLPKKYGESGLKKGERVEIIIRAI